jgi:hypothetical protein
MSSLPRYACVALATCVCLFAGGAARASSLQDDLTRCLVSHVTPADEDVMVTWTFALIALSPKLKLYTALTDAQRAAINQTWADLHTRLLTKDCRTETILVLKAEGELGIIPGLKTIAGGAMRAMLATPAGHAGAIDSTKLYRNTPQMDALRAEAGLPPNPK